MGLGAQPRGQALALRLSAGPLQQSGVLRLNAGPSGSLDRRPGGGSSPPGRAPSPSSREGQRPPPGAAGPKYLHPWFSPSALKRACVTVAPKVPARPDVLLWLMNPVSWRAPVARCLCSEGQGCVPSCSLLAPSSSPCDEGEAVAGSSWYRAFWQAVGYLYYPRASRSSLLWSWLLGACGGLPGRGDEAHGRGWRPGPRSAWEAEHGGLGGQEGPWHLPGLAELPAPICRGAAHPPQVGWETSELRSACSANILFAADGSATPFLPAVPVALPCAHPPVSCGSAFGDGEAVGQPRRRLALARLGAQAVGSVQRREALEPHLPHQGSSVLPGSHTSLFGPTTSQPRDLRRTREPVPGAAARDRALCRLPRTWAGLLPCLQGAPGAGMEGCQLLEAEEFPGEQAPERLSVQRPPVQRH